MNKRIAAIAAATALVAPLGLALTTTPADASVASVTHKIRPGDLVGSLSGTGTGGHVDFRTEGVALSSDNTSYQGGIAEYFAVGKRLAAVTAINFASYGPISQRYVIDADADGDVDGELVGSIDGGTMVQLTSSSSQLMKDAAPSGSPNYEGNLAAWSDNLPDAVIKFGGFASDPIASGETLVVRLSYGSDAYKFTSTLEKVKTDVTGYSKRKLSLRHARIDLYSVARPENAIRDAKLQWLIRVDRKTVFSVAQGFENHDFWAQTFRRATGKHLVRVFKNGARVRSFYVRTGH